MLLHKMYHNEHKFDITIQEIKNWLDTNCYPYIAIFEQIDSYNIYNLLFNNKLVESTNDVVNLYYGMYFNSKLNMQLMVKYYLIATDLGNCLAAYNLARFYNNKNDTLNMIKYYLISIDLGNSNAMMQLGIYYGSINDNDNMIKYLLMSINNNNSDAMIKLANYYKSINDNDNAIKYYLMATKLDNMWCINDLAKCYEMIGDYDNMINTYMIGYELGDVYSKILLIKYFQSINDYDNIIKCYLKRPLRDITSLIAYACNNKCSKILLLLHDNYFDDIRGYENVFVDAINTFLNKDIIDPDLLLLIANIDAKYFYNNNKLLTIIKHLLDNEVTLMDICFKCM